jgi:hypothetical protein
MTGKRPLNGSCSDLPVVREEDGMKVVLQLLFLSVVFGVLAIQAQDAGQMSANTKSSPDPAWSELNSGMAKMHTAMMMIEPSGNDDIDFVKMMLPHHQAAIDMARAELKYGTDPQMRRLAQEIVTEQQSEIELMQLWLKQHDSLTAQPKPASSSMK